MLLDALRGNNRAKRPPIWLMRQAGRYMPSYRAFREKYSLKELFFTPELAAKITMLPIEELGVDAAILFSDITVVATALGLELEFQEGPKVKGAFRPLQMDLLEPIFQTIRILKKELKVPLIGFCGGPFTVAEYIDPGLAHLDLITEASVEYVKMQQKAGVDVIQIFDSWANKLSPKEFALYSKVHLKKIVDAVDVPVILFMREASSYLKDLVALSPSAISFDWQKPLASIRSQVPMAVQGNLNPDLLYEPFDVIRKETRALLDSMRGDPGFIFNLGHGLKPDMMQGAVECLIDTVQERLSFIR